MRAARRHSILEGRGRLAALFAVAITAAATVPVSLSFALSTGHTHPALSFRVSPIATAFDTATKFACQKPRAADHCYAPVQIRAAYDIQALIDAGLDGRGKTIVIVDSFQDPTLSEDLKAFDNTFHLPPPPSFQAIAPFGLTPFDPTNANQVGWSGEIALDVEWAHAVAPGANIVLALAPSDSDADQINTEAYVVQHRLGDVISMSFGEGEQCMALNLQQQEHSLFSTATSQGITLVAASGDSGAAQFCTNPNSLFKAVSIPASDPNVTGVGGTNLIADLDTGAYGSESVWNDAFGSGGGGFSSLFPRPQFQNGTVSGSKRGVPDVSYSASRANGNVVAWGSGGTNFEYWIFGGTSMGSPQWAAIIAIADQAAGRDLGNVNPALYKIGNGSAATSDFHDITVGNNSFGGVSGYSAAAGWDAATGWGTPVASRLVASLAGI